MDDIDRKIIEKLQENSRASYKEIARDVKISDVAVHKRIKKLQKEVIRRFTVAVDQRSLGKGTTAILMVKCDVGAAPVIAERLSAMPDITEVYSTLGEYDIVAKIRTKDMETLKDIVEKQLRMIKGLHEIRTSIAFGSYKEEQSLVM
ncbi:MAG: Lrp/AsnC family transcriptional regulator [Methanobacteriota archaeon]|nr:MAG: Lrp/AsnC family transcriptional regulator [Euryarchaeota archaeon]